MRDQLFTSEVASEAAELQLPVIEVDVGVPVDDLTQRVGEALGLGAP
jgi:hypothetical protein